MSAPIDVFGFETSNNVKVRVALGFKDLTYEFHRIDPRDRTEVVRLSGQYLTPVLVHGDRVVFDSAAILRYLDATFPDRPRLFGASHREQWEIEDHELFARAILAAPMMQVVHHRALGGTVDDAMRARCDRAFSSAIDTLADRLAGREWLVGDRMTAADVTTAPVLHRVRSSSLLTIPDRVRDIDPWADRVLAHDRLLDRGTP